MIFTAINGRSYGNLEGLDICYGDVVAWHFLSSGGNEGLHGAVLSGHNLLIQGINRPSHLLVPEYSYYGLMKADFVGKDYSCIFTVIILSFPTDRSGESVESDQTAPTLH